MLVEDVSLEFTALEDYRVHSSIYVDEVPFETICRTLDGMDRDSIARCVFGYYDGVNLKLLRGASAWENCQNTLVARGYRMG